MARKSRKEKNMATNNAIFRYAAGYIRLSVANKDEACSVANQKLIVERWAAQQEIAIGRFYIDENYSGSSFKRPAFQEMLSDIDDGKIGCVIVKDLSRLGRELISTSYYIEENFPSKKVRFVSVNDQFDTVDGINNRIGSSPSRIRIPLTNAFNEQVSLDISHKTHDILDMKAQRGMFIGPRAPFGYRKSTENKFVIEPDPEAAAIVKEIFTMAAEGAGITAIVRYLNENDIPTPIQYARSNGLEGNYDDGDGVWNTRSVKYILTNRTYTGALVQGKDKRVVEGAHAPLVDSETFDSIQKSIQEKAFRITAGHNASCTEIILKGKVICGYCGSKMQRRRGTNHADWYFFTCLTNNRVGVDHCTGMYVREEDIFSAIYYQVKSFLDARFISKGQYEAEKEALEQEIADCKDISADPSERIRQYYERLVMKEISLSEFQSFKKNVYEAKERMDACAKTLEQYEQQYRQFAKMLKVRDKKLPLTEIVDCIEKITVHEGKTITVTWFRDL